MTDTDMVAELRQVAGKGAYDAHKLLMDKAADRIEADAAEIERLRKPPALKICPPHLHIRFATGDTLEGSTVLIGDAYEKGGCIDCDALDDTPFGNDEAVRIQEMWRGHD